MQINEETKIWKFNDIEDDVLENAFKGDVEEYMRHRQRKYMIDMIKRRVERYCFKCGLRLKRSSHDFIHKTCHKRHRKNLTAYYDSVTGVPIN